MGHTEKTEAKYTPGPWHFTASDPEGLVYSEDADFPIVPHQPSGFTRPEQIHNARLIAAAPDMLEALKVLLPDLITYQEDDIDHLTVELVAGHIQTIRAAIAIATK